jgi:Protein of unknown function (DUF2917)
MEFLVQGNLPLARGSMLCIEHGRDMLVYVWSGSLWITQQGDGRDRHVGAGGWFRITASGLTLISALGRSAISLTSPREAGFAQRIELVRAGTGRVETLFSAPRKTWRTWFAPQARPSAVAA